MSADDDVLKAAALFDQAAKRIGPPTLIIVGDSHSALGLPAPGAYELRDGEYFHVEIKSERKFGIMSFWDEEL